ncbi:MAG: DUF1697 domain-containing protein [Bacteroidia bacterium]|nr:DUF1697 domain-containing protein [Bacteroidia bacterium]NND52992.1 DUF1697 domain-containing protein [Flavobacteriaceae bacterium]
MNTFIALLRGINVGGHKKVPMADLRSLIEKLGLKNVRTYIQTGNIFFETVESDRVKLTLLIENGIKDHFRFEVPVIIKTSKEIDAIIKACPFPEAKKMKSYFSIFSKKPDKQLIEESNKISYPGEEFVITPYAVYFFCAAGYGRVKFNMNYFERKLKVASTTRNYKTMMKLLSLSEDKTA